MADRKKKIAVVQLLACSLQQNFKSEIECLRIIKCLNLDHGPLGKKSANGQFCNIGGGVKISKIWWGGNKQFTHHHLMNYCILSTSFFTNHMGLGWFK